MKNNLKNTVRAIETAPARTLLYFRLLMRKQGMTVADQRKAVGNAVESGKIGERRGDSFTPHNTYSLGLLAATYGQEFCSFTDDKGVVRYMFRSVDNADVFDAHYPDFAAMQAAKASRQRKQARDAAKAEAEAQAMRDARKAERDARKQAATPAKAPATPALPVAPSLPAKAPATLRKALRKAPVAPASVVIASQAIAGNDTLKGA
jgi:hypothetical protein